VPNNARPIAGADWTRAAVLLLAQQLVEPLVIMSYPQLLVSGQGTPDFLEAFKPRCTSGIFATR
jgi:hypothetical protein